MGFYTQSYTQSDKMLMDLMNLTHNFTHTSTSRYEPIKAVIGRSSQLK